MRVMYVGFGGMGEDRLSPEHARLIRGMDAVCFPYDKPRSLAGAHWWIAWDDDGEPAGFAGILPLPDATWYLCRIGVLPSYRGKGLARRLLRARVAKARACGAEVVVTDCIPENVPSANNLISGGFKLYTPENQWAANSLYWRLEL